MTGNVVDESTARILYHPHVTEESPTLVTQHVKVVEVFLLAIVHLISQ